MSAPLNDLDATLAAYNAMKAAKEETKLAQQDLCKTLPAVSDKEAAREINLRLALKLARAGIKIFPNVDKYPQIIRWQLDGDSLSDAEREKHNTEWKEAKEKSGTSHSHVAPKPAHHIGATSDKRKIKLLWDEFPNATPSISLGLNNLIVIDADMDRAGKKGEREICNGPALLAQMFNTNGFDPKSTFSTKSRSGGQHFYFANPNKLHNSGVLKASANCDVKGNGGYVVSPGSIRISDGKTYGTAASGDEFIAAVKVGLPIIPDFVASKFGTYTPKTATGDGDQSERLSGSQSDETIQIKALQSSLRDLGVSDTVPATGSAYDTADLVARHVENEKALDLKRDDSQSAIRWRFLQMLRSKHPTMSAIDGLAVCTQAPEVAGKYIGLRARGKEEHSVLNLYTFCRDWTRVGTESRPPSDGDSFGAINEEDSGMASLDNDQAIYIDDYVLFGKAGELLEDFMARTEAAKVAELKKHAAEKAKLKAEMRALKYAPMVCPKPFKYIATSLLPPRQFIWGDWFALQTITLLVAPGSRGKSALMLAIAICMACGVDYLCGLKLYRPRKVFLYNAEDTEIELQRRAAAFMEWFDFTPELIALVEANLHIQSGVDHKLMFTQTEKGVVAAREQMIDDLEEFLTRHGIEYMFLDPLVTLHDSGENDNKGMETVMRIFDGVQGRTKIGTCVAHHTTKVSANTQQDANAARGAGAIVTGVRITLNINSVQESLHGAYGIVKDDDEWRYLAVGKGGKNNLSPRDKTVCVLKLNTMIAKNGTAEFKNDSNFALSRVERVAATGLSDGQIMEVLAVIKEGTTQTSPRSDSFKALLDLIKGMEDGRTDKEATNIIADFVDKDWINRKGSATVNRRPREVFQIGSKRPPTTDMKYHAIDDE